MVVSLLRDWFGWESVVDLGGIATWRGVEMFSVLWQGLQNWSSSYMFKIKLVS